MNLLTKEGGDRKCCAAGCGVPGFTLIEIVVATLIISLSVCTFGTMILTSKHWLSKAYYKTKAMDAVSTKMEENLARSYSGLTPGTRTSRRCVGTDWENDGLSETDCEAQAGIYFKLDSLVEDRLSDGTLRIPYKRILVNTMYRKDGVDTEISMVNFVPYPFVHVVSNGYISNPFPMKPAQDYIPFRDYAAVRTISIKFPVKKNLQISYNLAISVDDATDIEALHTIYTRCRVGGTIAFPETRTPIITQPVINNWVQIDNVPSGDNDVVIEWYKEADTGIISLISSSVVIVAVENLL